MKLSRVIRGPLACGLVACGLAAMGGCAAQSEPATAVPAEYEELVARADTPPSVAIPGEEATGAPGSDRFGAGIELRTEVRAVDPMASQKGAIESAMAKLRDAKSNDEKKTATKELHGLLDDIFARDLEARDAQVKEIEGKVEQLREQLLRRSAARKDIVELQLQRLINEASGLAFPDDSRGAGGREPKRLYPGQAEKTLRPWPTGAVRKTPSRPIEAASKTASLPGIEAVEEKYSLSASLQARASELVKKGHFVASSDGKLYAVVEDKSPTTARIELHDAKTGKILSATGDLPKPIGALVFVKEGVAARNDDGSLSVHLPFPGSVTTVPAQTTTEAPASADPTQPPLDGRIVERAPEPTHSHPILEALGARRATVPANATGGATGESLILSSPSEFQRSLREAEKIFAAANGKLEVELIVLKRTKPSATVEDCKSDHPNSNWMKVETARRDFQILRDEYETQVRLLEIELQAAKSALDIAVSQMQAIQGQYKAGVAPTAEVTRAQGEVAAAEARVQRVRALLDLYSKINPPSLPQPRTPEELKKELKTQLDENAKRDETINKTAVPASKDRPRRQ